MKMKFSHYILWGLTGVASFANVANAQSGDQNVVNIDFSCMSWDGFTDEEVFYRNGNDWEVLRMPPLKRSEKFDYQGKPSLVLYTERPNQEGQLTKVPFGSVNIDVAMKEVLLVFVANRGNESEKRPYSVFAIEDSKDNFPFGSYKIYNFTNVDFAGIIDSEKFTLPPRQSTVVKPGIGERKNVEVRFFNNKSQKWQSWRETVWTYEPDLRLLVLITPSARGNRPGYELKTVVEYQ